MGGCFSDVNGGKEAVGGLPAAQGVNDAVDHFLQSNGYRGLYTPLELSLSASKLRDLDIFSKSDPMAVIYLKKQGNVLEELGRTEVMMNTLHPVWITKFTINYQFEIVQPLLFRVFDVDTRYHNVPVKKLKLSEQDFVGEASCALSEIVARRGCSLTLNLQFPNIPTGPRLGTITVCAEETFVSRVAVEMIFHCIDLENKDTFSKSDPFLRISKIAENGVAIPICKTEVINNNLNPVWKPVVLTVQQYGSKENPLVIDCFDFNTNGTHESLGTFQGSISNLEILSQEKTGAHLYHASSVNCDHKKTLKGQLFVDKFHEKIQYNFLDYISSGFELNFMVAIDFTASNGNPRLPDSLHYIDPYGRLNAYQQAIVGVGEVLQFYDSDKRFPAWAFGARPANGTISHCLNLNGNPDDCEVVGIEGIMSSYSLALHNLSLSGPTLFGPVINEAGRIASQSLSSCQNKYYILLIITDGVITDLQETINAIVRASDLPLSILIVGVGGADFKEMEILDCDNGKRLKSSTGRLATRDIVQFVPMRELHGQISISQSLLEELPWQFLEYMRNKGIEPLYSPHTKIIS